MPSRSGVRIEVGPPGRGLISFFNTCHVLSREFRDRRELHDLLSRESPPVCRTLLSFYHVHSVNIMSYPEKEKP